MIAALPVLSFDRVLDAHDPITFYLEGREWWRAMQ